MLMHFDAYSAVLDNYIDFPSDAATPVKDLVFIDFGCGPMTSGLAIVDYLKQRKTSASIKYIGIDDMPTMQDIAAQFARRINADGLSFSSRFCDSWNRLMPDIVGELLVSENTTIVFNFSYFFGQGRVLSQGLSEIVAVIKEILASFLCSPREVFLVYLNVVPNWDRLNNYNSKYMVFKELYGLMDDRPLDMHYTFNSLNRINEQEFDVSSQPVNGRVLYEVLRLL